MNYDFRFHKSSPQIVPKADSAGRIEENYTRNKKACAGLTQSVGRISKKASPQIEETRR